jgi:hypothetical protein
VISCIEEFRHTMCFCNSIMEDVLCRMVDSGGLLDVFIVFL